MNFVTKVKALLTTMSGTVKVRTILISTLGVFAIGGTGIGAFSAYEHFYGPEAVISAAVDEESIQIETEELVAAVTEVVEETQEMETETETATEEGPVLVTLVGSSIEKDLKIKIQDEEKQNIKGVEFYITVTPDKNNATTSTYRDHDNDGIVYITDIDGGDYVVALEEIEGYYTEEKSIKVKVKELIEYVKVEVADEIKTEAEVSPEEDAQTKEVVEIEAEIQDTVPWLDSNVTSTAVDAATIDKTPYLSSVAVVGANGETVTVPTTSVTPVVSFSIRNLFLMRVGTEEEILTITEQSSEVEQTSETGSSSEAEQVKETEQSSETEQPSQPDNSMTSVTPATLVMPKTVSMYISSRSTANTAEFSITIDDKNVTPIINEADIVWSVKNDTTGDGTAESGLTVIGNGKTVKVSTANSKVAGTATVVATIPYTVNGTSASVALECVVTVNEDFYDSTIVLEDYEGNLLYTDTACTIEATVADLIEKNVTTFYKEPKYQGWQAIGGKLYYYGEDYTPVTGEQTICGMIYDFGTDGALSQGTSATGIDVSKYQPNVDWATVKASGIDFVIIRVGYRGSATGVLVEDPYFEQHIKGATEAGLKVGVYFFTQAVTKAEAVEEASMALALTERYNLQYPIFIDTEKVSGSARANDLDKNTRTEIVEAFCKTIENAGREAGVYASKSWYDNQLNTSMLGNYCIWVAQYNTECTYTGRYSIWQYTETGKVPGIDGNVDLNISYMN